MAGSYAASAPKTALQVLPTLHRNAMAIPIWVVMGLLPHRVWYEKQMFYSIIKSYFTLGLQTTWFITVTYFANNVI